MIKYTEEECADLEGKEVFWSCQGSFYKGIVAHCHPDIGLTILNKDDTDDKLTCLRGPSTIYWEKDKDFYVPFFNASISMLKMGSYSGDASDVIWAKETGRNIGYGQLAECAFE